MSEIIGKSYNPYGMAAGTNGLIAGFQMGDQLRRQRGLASGFANYQRATDDAGRKAALQEMAQADPLATMGFVDRQWQQEHRNDITPYQQAMLDLKRDELAQNALNQQAEEQKKQEELVKKQEEEQKSLNNAQLGVNTMKEIADAGNLGKSQGLTSWFDDDVRYDQGRLSGAIAAVAPRALSKLKAAGVSGVNTLGEFMTYVGLPQNATSDQIAAAVPLISEIIGAENPYSSSQNAGIAQTQKSGKVNMNMFSSMSDDDLLKGL